MTSERTRLLIADKMKELMKQKSLDKIRTTEICALADIQRTTFYYHFQDKYDLVAWVFFHSSGDVDLIDVDSAAKSMSKMKNDMIFYKRAYEDTSQNALWGYLVEYFAASYASIAKEKLGTDILDSQLAFSIRLYCYGAVSMTKEWVLYDNKTSAKTMVKMMFSSMPEILRKIYFS